MRPSPIAALLLLALLLAAPAVRGSPAAAGGDPAAEAAARLQEKWSEGVDAMAPEEVDRHRAALLEPVAASGSLAGLRAVLKVARERAGQVDAFRRRLEDIAEFERKKAEREAEEKRLGGDAPKTKPADAPRSAEEMEKRVLEEKRRIEDAAKHPGRIEREGRWLPRLAAAAGPLLDALPDGEFEKQADPLLREAMGDRLEGWDAWLASALGGSRKPRTARFLLVAGEEALGEYRKALVERVKSARDLDKVNDEYNERILKFLEQAGNPLAVPPDSLVENLLPRKRELEGVVLRQTSAMESADRRRRAARTSYGAMLAGAPEAERTALLDLLFKEALGSRDFESRCFGLGALGPCPGDRAMAALREAAKDPVPVVVVTAVDALAVRSEAEALEILAAAVADPRWQVRAAAAAGLGASGRAAAVLPLIEALKKAEGRTVDDLHAALVALTGRTLPAAAAAWEAWWAKDGANFRGPKDPGYGEAAKGGGAEGGGEAGAGAADGGGNRVSFYGIETRSERMLFILDFSGSMNFAGSSTEKERKKIDVLLEEMRRTLAGLPDGSKFNIIGFSADVRVWKKGPQARDAKTAKDAMEWVEKQAVIGSTNIYDALETGFKAMGVGAGKDKSYEPVYDTIFFMTDGKPTSGKVQDTSLILGDVRRWNDGRKIRIHVVGMGGKEKGGAGPRGDDLDRKFLEDLAEQNQGKAVFR